MFNLFTLACVNAINVDCIYCLHFLDVFVHNASVCDLILCFPIFMGLLCNKYANITNVHFYPLSSTEVINGAIAVLTDSTQHSSAFFCHDVSLIIFNVQRLTIIT